MTKTVTINSSLIDAARGRSDATPYILTDLDLVRKNCETFRHYLPNFKLFYAVKALFTDEIIHAIDDKVSGFDVASIGEIDRLLRLGISSKRLHFSNPVKSESSIKTAYELGITTFTIQSEQELSKIARNAPNSKIFIRVKLDDTRSLVPLSQKFGCNSGDIESILRAADREGLRICGVAFHVGSQVLDVNVWDEALKRIHVLVCRMRELGVEVTCINVGGGFPTKYFDDDTDISMTAKHILKNISSDEMKYLEYIAEPGRYIVANSSVIVSSVIGTEYRDNENWLFLDTGLFQSFLGAVRYDIFPYMPIALKHWNGNEDIEYDSYTLTGPTCDSEDIIAVDIILPKDIEPGDLLVFPNVGAYTTVYGSEFNGFSLPTRHYLHERTGDV